MVFFGSWLAFFVFYFFLFYLKKEREIMLNEYFSNGLPLPPWLLKLYSATHSLINHSDHFAFSGILSADFLLPFPLPQKSFWALPTKNYPDVSPWFFRTLTKNHVLTEMLSHRLSVLRQKLPHLGHNLWGLYFSLICTLRKMICQLQSFKTMSWSWCVSVSPSKWHVLCHKTYLFIYLLIWCFLSLYKNISFMKVGISFLLFTAIFSVPLTTSGM